MSLSYSFSYSYSLILLLILTRVVLIIHSESPSQLLLWCSRTSHVCRQHELLLFSLSNFTIFVFRIYSLKLGKSFPSFLSHSLSFRRPHNTITDVHAIYHIMTQDNTGTSLHWRHKVKGQSQGKGAQRAPMKSRPKTFSISIFLHL